MTLNTYISLYSDLIKLVQGQLQYKKKNAPKKDYNYN